ncbi:hypothetical protein FPOAC1_009856 [Fusarium poae]|uniref:hypothetical protein n=1 Tax=Fusarium poae TaxID=36050 RepID=UPI001CEB9D3D|nr:hypothetical protein FPOAC1_009856 [Fusarium poae]KAG8670442.1 hypothetical protein FPOAC1_009856 [Fusarium poae]
MRIFHKEAKDKMNEPPHQGPTRKTTTTQVKKRRLYTRNRTGCSECRSRRVKCDEQRPNCQNCIKKQLSCHYLPPRIPLREQRVLDRAGEKQPWNSAPWNISQTEKELPKTTSLTHQLIVSGSANTFNCVAIDMPFRSKELFSYFYHAGLIYNVCPSGKVKDCLAYIISDPEALQNAVLIAGTHFLFNIGSLEAFEPTFLFHKIETIRRVKEWISGNNCTPATAIIRKITTLAYTEVCRGELLLAESHLSVIYAISKSTNHEMTVKRKTLDQELSDRYFLLTSTFIHGFKIVIDGILRWQGSTKNATNLSSSESVRTMHEWHKTDEGRFSHSLKLRAFRMLPAFFHPPESGAQLEDVDIIPYIQGFRKVTETFCSGLYTFSGKHLNSRADEFWRLGPASVLYDVVIEAHLDSISYNKDEEPDAENLNPTASWCGLIISAQLYLEHVVAVWQDFKKEIYIYTIYLFQRELRFALSSPQAPQVAKLLFWESILGLISIESYEKKGVLDQDPGLRLYFEAIVKTQSQTLGTSTWDDVRSNLAHIAWPSKFPGDSYVKGIWEKAMASGSAQRETS